MRISLDGESLFDEQQLRFEVDSIGRASIERSVTGLDGVVSVDLGKRSRKIKQKGTLRTTTRSQMNERTNAISAYMDGAIHGLEAGEAGMFDDVRMDSFRIVNESVSGSGLVVDYEIVYTQLVV